MAKHTWLASVIDNEDTKFNPACYCSLSYKATLSSLHLILQRV